VFEVAGKYSAKSLAEHFKEKDVFTIAISPTQVRMVTHLGLTENMIDQVLQLIGNL
jgi:threonine aldolase